MTTALTRLSGSAFEITLTVPWSDVKKTYDTVFDELAQSIEIEGFRKGKAPQHLIESKIDKSKVYGEVINRILPESYAKALAEHGLQPIISPKIQIVSGEEEKDWQFIARAAEKPKVTLNNYQEVIKTINAKGKIWTPQGGGISEEASKEKEKDAAKAKKINALIDKLLEICQVDLAELITESETNRLMTQLIDDIRQAGLTFEQYLQSSSQTADQIREKYRKQAENTLKLEFVFDAIADDLKVQVNQAEIDAIINKESDPTKKKALQDQSYVLASIMRRENTITRLLSL